MAKGFNLKKVLKGAVDSTVNAVSKADLSGVVEKIQETVSKCTSKLYVYTHIYISVSISNHGER